MNSAASTMANEAIELLDAMDLLFSEARDALERRFELRVPFFRAVSLEIEDAESSPEVCFARDLSPSGTGLLHPGPVDKQRAIVTIPLESGDKVRMEILIKWSRPCGEGWYLSGTKFLRVARD